MVKRLAQSNIRINSRLVTKIYLGGEMLPSVEEDNNPQVKKRYRKEECERAYQLANKSVPNQRDHKLVMREVRKLGEKRGAQGIDLSHGIATEIGQVVQLKRKHPRC